MNLEAKTVSSLILSTLDSGLRRARVHSCYRRATNVLCDDKVWLSLHPAGVPLHPYCISVDGASDYLSGKRFLDADDGERVSVSRSLIDIGGGRVRIDLRNAHVWQSRLDPHCAHSAPEGVQTRGALRDLVGRTSTESWFLAAVLKRKPGEGPCRDTSLSSLRGKAARTVARMGEAWRSQSLEATLRAMKGVIGLGMGLTPSGDDFLTGFLGASYFFSHTDGFRKKVFAGAVPLVHRTTLPSGFMLSGALGGHYPEPLSDLLLALGRGDSQDLRRSLNRLADIGATSGHDMLAGVLCWIEISRGCGVIHEARNN